VLGQWEQALVEIHGQLPAPGSRQGQGDDPGQRPAGHGGQVAQVDGQGLAPDTPRIDSRQLEIHPVGKQIDRQHALPLAGQAEHGSVVADPQVHEGMRADALAQVPDQFGFHGNPPAVPEGPG